MTTEITTEKTTENLNPNQLTVRNSGVELLRIITILLICISHAVQTATQFLLNHTLSFGMVYLITILRSSGQIGNILFVICSSWFLLDSKKVKLEKPLKILMDSTLISIFIFLCFVISGYKFSTTEIINQLFPDYFANMWFIPVYVIFYMVHPLLNSAINAMDKKSHFSFCLIIFCLFGVLGLIGWGGIVMNSFVEFCVVYIIVGFMKKYCQSFYENKNLNLILFLVFYSIFLFANLIKFAKPQLTLDQFYSPILLPTLLCLFNLFNRLNIQSKKINYFASSSLFVYCIHENILLRSYIRPLYFEQVFAICFKAYFGWIMLCAFGMFFCSYLLSFLYKHSISKVTKNLGQIISKWLITARDKAFSVFFKD